jgi:DNA-binding XRE family transcriptional regulator
MNIMSGEDIWHPQRILTLRKRLGLKQSEAAAAIGLTRPAWCMMEKGRYKPSGPVCVLLRLLDDGTIDAKK